MTTGASTYGFLLGLLGVVLLFHSGFLMINHRDDSESSISTPYIAIVAELLTGFIFCYWSALTTPGPFLPIRIEEDSNRLVKLPFDYDFISFNHRSKIIPKSFTLNK